MSVQNLDIETIKTLVDEEPCASAVALITLLSADGKYPPPMGMNDQKVLVSSLSSQVVVDWDTILDHELNHIQNQCLQSEVDFDFVIDSSGSVGKDYWKMTMEFIGDNAIKRKILPIGSKKCGNHVAGRWFSTKTTRFYDFEPPERNVFNPETYPNYVGNKFIEEPYHNGKTNTGGALEAVRIQDVPTERAIYFS